MTVDSSKVTVVLLSYNRPAGVKRTLESLLAQSFGSFELIICDDGSDPDTRSVLTTYEVSDPRIRVLWSKQNLGMPMNVNRGIAAARFDMVAICHDGDYYAPDAIEKWRGALLRCPSAAFAFNAYALDRGSGEVDIDQLVLPECMSGLELLDQTYLRRWRFDCPTWGTVMLRRSQCADRGLFDSRFGAYADVDMWLRSSACADVAYVSEPIVVLPRRSAVPSNFQGDLESFAVLGTIYREAFFRRASGLPRGQAVALLLRYSGYSILRWLERGALSCKRTICAAACRLRQPYRSQSLE